MKTQKEKALETLLVLSGAFVFVFWITNKKIFLLLALIFVAIGIFSPWLAEKISWLWLKFSEVLGYVMSKVILSIVFFVFLLPLSLMQKIFKKDSFSLKRKSTSYYTERDHLYTGKDLENMW